ncbi:MAG: hypothetical protein M3Z05_23335, partial [Gemmatimonadota bacterium]|nr:hypothetical protein [Gemmatimonadota bacterium]
AARGQDPAGRNIQPGRFMWGVDDDSPGNEGDYYGVLQVHLWGNGTLVEGEQFGMRLDYVGPNVRARLKAIGGTLRDIPMNKVIKVYGHQRADRVENEPMYGFLITADNRISLAYNDAKADVALAENAQDMSIGRLTA